jgi:hypothetical protein
MSSSRTRGNKVQSLRLYRIKDKAETIIGKAIISKLVTYCR